MARASTYTLLALDRWAKIMGVTGAHFNQAAGADGTILPIVGDCGDVWWQYAWQHADQVSREDLAMAIADAEHDIANWLGYWPAPMWIENEMHQYPRPYRPDVYDASGLNVRWQQKSVTAKFGKIIQAGRRATSEITADVAVVYSDPDGDGYDELATITTPTTLTDRCEIKCYFDGHGGEQIWEIRPPKSIVISGGNVTLTFDSWQLLDPDLWEQLPTESSGLRDIDLTVAANYVSTVDVYREFTDFTANSSEFFWERVPTSTLTGGTCCNSCGGSGCEACSLITQGGCLHIRSVDNGIVVPTTATYSEDDGAWTSDCFSQCRDPDQVKIWYYGGNLSQNWFQETTCDPLDNSLANCIVWMATARLERPICACNNSQALSIDLKRDLSFTPPDGGGFFVSEGDLDNPFGTRKGEIMAWKKISRLVERTPAVASI